MGKKKLKLEINFQQTILKWDKKSSKRTDLLSVMNEQSPTFRKWTEEEEFSGKTREINYLDGVSVVLTRVDGYKFSNPRLENSSYYYNYSHFDETSSIRFERTSDGFEVNGTLFLNVSIDSKDYSDYFESNLLHFESMNFRVKGTGDLVGLKKYGTNWELEREDCNEYRKGNSQNYLNNLPELSFKK
jgi:hypothetical protein|tara:strand:+ start:469 stop:1029 length:561 start_codon:yes stop_codon:yes gene_type:complete